MIKRAEETMARTGIGAVGQTTQRAARTLTFVVIALSMLAVIVFCILVYKERKKREREAEEERYALETLDNEPISDVELGSSPASIELSEKNSGQ
jgi:ABC-type anion transport system duplicated permease subunit